MKKILMSMMVVMLLFMAACTPAPVEEEPIEEPIEENPDEVSFNERMSFLEDNNFELEIKITDHQDLDDTIVMMYFDGTTIQYVDGSYEAYYDISAEQAKLYEKKGDTFEVKNINFNQSGLLFYGFEFDMFSKINVDQFVLKQNQYENLDSFIALGDGITDINNLAVYFNEANLDRIVFDIHVGEVIYLVTLTIKEVGQVNLVLPV